MCLQVWHDGACVTDGRISGTGVTLGKMGVRGVMVEHDNPGMLRLHLKLLLQTASVA